MARMEYVRYLETRAWRVIVKVHYNNPVGITLVVVILREN